METHLHRAVIVSQVDGSAEIRFWHGSPDIQGEPPRNRTITANEARALGEALIHAADLLAEILPDRCSCGEPIETDQGLCVMCFIAANRRRRAERRANIKAVK